MKFLRTLLYLTLFVIMGCENNTPTSTDDNKPATNKSEIIVENPVHGGIFKTIKDDNNYATLSFSQIAIICGITRNNVIYIAEGTHPNFAVSSNGNIDASGNINIHGIYKSGGTPGISGSCLVKVNGVEKTLTFTNGLITGLK